MPTFRSVSYPTSVWLKLWRSTARTDRILSASCVVLLFQGGCGGSLDNDNVLARTRAAGRSGSGGATHVGASGGAALVGASGGTTNDTPDTAGAAGADQCSSHCSDGRVCRKVVNAYECVTASCGPELVKKVKLPEEDGGLVVLGGGYAYVVTKTAVEVADIRSPREPRLIGELAGAFGGIALKNNRLYLADSANGLAVADVSIPERPMLVTAVAVTGGVSCVRADSGVLYLCAGNEEQKSGFLQVVDINQPELPVLRGRLAMPPAVRSIDSAGPLVYLVDGTGQFVVVDATNLDHPTTLASLSVTNANYVKLSGSRALVGANDLVVVDVTEPTRPTQIANIYAHDAIRSLDVEGNLVGYSTVYAYNTGSFFRALDLSDLAQPVSSPVLGDSAYRNWAGPMVALDNGFAYVAEMGDLAVYDVSTPVNQRIVTSMPLQSGHVTGMELQDSLAYIIEMGYGPSGSLQVVSTSDPMHPTLLGSMSVLATGLAVRDQRAYVLKMMSEVGIGDEFLQVDLYNPYDPLNPRQIGSLSLDETLTDKFNGQIGVVPAGDTAYLLGREVISIVRLGQTIDVDHTDDPQLVRTLDLPGATLNRIRFTATHAFVTASVSQGDTSANSGSLLVYDLADPGDPQQVGALATQVGLSGLEIVGSYAYVGANGKGLMVIDVSTPSIPRVAGTVDTPLAGEDELVIRNNMAYLGKAVVDVTSPEHPVYRYAIDIPGTLRQVSSTGRLFTISDGFSGKYGGRAAELNYIDPARCAP